jgi:hypothetical protein
MFVNGIYIVPVGRPLPYIGEVKWARGPDGVMESAIVKEIIGLKWISDSKLEVTMVFETNVEKKEKKVFMKNHLAVLPGAVPTEEQKKKNQGVIG